MNKKGQFNLGVIILLAVGVIFSLAIMDEIINTQSELTNKLTVTDETTNLQTSCLSDIGEVNQSNTNCNITVDNWYDSGDWKESESQCYLAGVTVTNSSADALTVNTDYLIDSDAGVIAMLNTSDTINSTMGNSILVDYNYCGEGYNKDSSSRSIAGLFTLFAALAILAFATIGIKNWIK